MSYRAGTCCLEQWTPKITLSRVSDLHGFIIAGGIAGVMVAQGVRFLYNGYCIVGMSRLASILIMSYDTFTNLSLTLLFIAPLFRSTIRNTRLRTIAKRAAIASFLGLIIEMINGFILFALDGKEMIWVCLGACTADIVANAVLLYWAMDSPSSSSKNRSHSIHFSSIQRTNPAEIIVNQTVGSIVDTEARQKNPARLGALRDCAVHMSIPEDPFSDDSTIASSECVPTLGRPKPVLVISKYFHPGQNIQMEGSTRCLASNSHY
ncbi:transmembrane protein [Rhizoctonia solani]|uniref:Transmembrane protein n=1 Tax=Rhizoctonia solani TaxID=456999 RepID=A0A8H8T2D4_9AGAM|nr:uncharacterized protein RhiXN_01354 [Rhizoctonia solani]QRW26759.1 transmembrane protein [Rhizoctonia solani]